MQESKSRSSDARSVKDNEEEDTAEQRREDGDGCRDGTMEGGGIPHICHGRHGRRPCKFFWLV